MSVTGCHYFINLGRASISETSIMLPSSLISCWFHGKSQVYWLFLEKHSVWHDNKNNPFFSEAACSTEGLLKSHPLHACFLMAHSWTVGGAVWVWNLKAGDQCKVTNAWTRCQVCLSEEKMGAKGKWHFYSLHKIFDLAIKPAPPAVLLW